VLEVVEVLLEVVTGDDGVGTVAGDGCVVGVGAGGGAGTVTPRKLPLSRERLFKIS